MKISSCRPGIALPGGTVRLEIEDLPDLDTLAVIIGDEEAEVMSAASQRITVRVPETEEGTLEVHAGGKAASVDLKIGRVLADELHPVANPVVDPQGNIFVTYSGSRGESVPFGVFVVSADGVKEPFLGDITNPTGLAIGPDGLLYISSRHSGAVYRSTMDKQVEKFVEGLGIATGIAFDSLQNLLVGDRSGTIYRVNRAGELSTFCELEPSVSAYHLSMDPFDNLYVTGPTLASQDCIYRVRPDGTIEELFKGFGRPQGTAFDSRGILHVVGSYRGRKGMFRLVEGQVPDLVVTSPMLVGLAFDLSGKILYLVDGSRLFRIDL